MADDGKKLRVLNAEVAQRVAAMEASHGSWPCREGCDSCCRRLGALPDLSPPEFRVLWRAFGQLPSEVQTEVFARIDALALDGNGHCVCPLLDEVRGACRVYDARPVACRTYGYYAGRDGDYWCDRVTAHLGARRSTLVAGNQLAIDRRRDASLGPSTDLVTLFTAARRAGTPGA